MADPDPPSAVERMAQGAIALLVAAAVAVTVGAILDAGVVLAFAVACGVAGLALLLATALKGGRKDAPPP